jgi:hypothetical protein
MGSTANSRPPTQTYPPGHPDHWLAVWLRSAGVCGLLLVGTIVSWKYNQRQNRNADNDLKLKQRAFEFQTDLESAKMAISVIPMISCDDDIKRESALEVLDTFKPSLNEDFRPAAKYEKALIAILQSKCPRMPQLARSEISDLRQRASLQQVQNDFLTNLANAREYQTYGFDRTAARLFYEARNRLPEALAGKVDKAELEKATDAYEQGNFSEASGRFQKAFSRIP